MRHLHLGHTAGSRAAGVRVLTARSTMHILAVQPTDPPDKIFPHRTRVDCTTRTAQAQDHLSPLAQANNLLSRRVWRHTLRVISDAFI